MSRRREAMLEVLCFVTGLEAAEVEKRPRLCDLLKHADIVKGRTGKYQYGIFTFLWPRKKKDGTVVPFLGLRINWDGMEKEELRFRTFDADSDGMDAEFGLTDAEVDRFVGTQARKAEKEAAKTAQGAVRRRVFRQRPSKVFAVSAPSVP